MLEPPGEPKVRYKGYDFSVGRMKYMSAIWLVYDALERLSTRVPTDYRRLFVDRNVMTCVCQYPSCC